MIYTAIDTFYLSEEQLINSPSRKDGIDDDTETTLRIYGCDLIQECGILLKLPQAVMATGQVLFHRFYCKKSFARFNVKRVAASCVWLASKLEESPRKARQVLLVFHRMECRREGLPLEHLETSSKKYVDLKADLIRTERHLLKEMGFICHVEHPHKFISNYLATLETPAELRQEAWNLANDSLRTTLCVRFKSEVVACGVVYAAARRFQVPLPENPPWWKAFDADKAGIDEVCRVLAHLYSLPKAQYIPVCKEGGSFATSNRSRDSPSIPVWLNLRLPLNPTRFHQRTHLSTFKKQPEIHLFAARLREQCGDITGARAAYQLVHAEISPGLVEAIIKHANMERRLGNLEDACSVYEQAIAIEKGKEHSQSLPLLFAQYSRFLYMVSGKVEKAREILEQAVENVQLLKPLLEALIHLESIQSLPKRIDLLDSLVNKFIVPFPENPSTASVDEREELSSIFLEFLDLFGDVTSIKKADDRHAKLFVRHKTSSDSKKRQAEDYLVSEKTKLAKSAVAASNPSVAGAYPGAQNQWPAGYGAQGQTWPQAAQVQPQQFNPGYAQQATYGAYGSYGGYAAPQAPASASSSAGYGAYPSAYPAQAFPQQKYAQPAAAATLTPAPQATTVPPTAYYGSYY